MKTGETTKWANIAFDRIPSELPNSSLPNVHLTTVNSNTNGYASSSSLNHHRYRTELSLNVGDYTYVQNLAITVSLTVIYCWNTHSLSCSRLSKDFRMLYNFIIEIRTSLVSDGTIKVRKQKCTIDIVT